MELSRRELKIPLRVLCLLSYKIESRGPPGLRAELTINSCLGRCSNVTGGDSFRRAGRDTSLMEGGWGFGPLPEGAGRRSLTGGVSSTQLKEYNLAPSWKGPPLGGEFNIARPEGVPLSLRARRAQTRL